MTLEKVFSPCIIGRNDKIESFSNPDSAIESIKSRGLKNYWIFSLMTSEYFEFEDGKLTGINKKAESAIIEVKKYLDSLDK
jgi:hypothetical protein